MKKEKGFLFFKKRKKGKSATPPGSGTASSTPKYSQGATFPARKYSAPRYSQGSIGRFFRNIKFSPPRYSAVLARNQQSRRFKPKYSKASPFKGKAFGVAPRYSRPVSYKGSKFGGTPRYSKPTSWKGANFAGTPRYSKPVSWKGTPYGGTPRYSKAVSWKGAYFPGTPRYSSFKHRFDVNRRSQQQTRPYQPWVGQYTGFVKYKRPHIKNMHPSVNYLMAKNISSKAIKKGLRKWNIFWMRLNPSKESPSGTRNVARKPKFDKKEKDIWANGRDEKPTTRKDASAGAEKVPISKESNGNNP